MANPQNKTLPSPNEIVAHLDRYVKGQEDAKRDLAVAVYNHYLSQAHRVAMGRDLGRHHILMLGPTGVGKTYLVKTLAEYLGVPVGFTSAAGLVEAGYKGNSVESIVRSLLDRANGNTRVAERGIVFIDELDKIKRSETSSRDISGEGVQNALLTLMDGRVSRGMEGMSHGPVDTSRLLFICTGAFVGLKEIVEKRLGKVGKAIGFAPPQRVTQLPEDAPDRPTYEALRQSETEDLVSFGLIPELLGRFATVTALHELGLKELREIASEATEDSALERQQRLAELHGISLRFEEGALEAIARKAEALGTGARGLHRLIGIAVDSVDFRWQELAESGVSEVVVDANCVETGGEARLVKGGRDDTEKSLAERLRCVALSGEELRLAEKPDVEVEGGESRQWMLYRKLKAEDFGWDEASAPARAFWQEYEASHEDTPAILTLTIEELTNRDARLQEFYEACAQSGTTNIQANLHYLDFLRLK